MSRRPRTQMPCGRHLARLLAVLFAASAMSLVCVTASAPARGTRLAPGLYIHGGGAGHGVGMSQYGALGFALHGWSDRRILAWYYRGTTLGSVRPAHLVTVLLADGGAAFSGGSAANGRPLPARATCGAIPRGRRVELVCGRARLLLRAPVTVSGRGPLHLLGAGSYRGALILRPTAAGIETVNAVPIEQYVRGVIAGEMPASWPAAALQAQAVAARTFALTATPESRDFELYDDTRSQMYGGVGAQTPATDAATAATAGRVVDYAGAPVLTPFFASSGGHTESIENVWAGTEPEPWLRGVPDPYDDSGGNPYYRWTVRMSLARAQALLSGVVRGALRGIRVLTHGVSPRVVQAAVIGTRGTATVSGSELEQLLGTPSTDMSFTTVTSHGTVTSRG